MNEETKKWWSFQKVSRPEVPGVKDKAWPNNPIDNFILSKLESVGLAPAQPASREALVRRVYYDLIGRQPTAEYAKGSGRDHNAYGFTMWMAGGGIKGGVSLGKTDELGATAVEDRMHVKRIHATILQQMGLDPNRLSYFYGGLDQRLVGVEGAKPITELIA